VIFGALFVRLLPQFIAIIRDDLPFGIGRMPGLEPSLYGLVLVIVILFEPGGIYGRWIKMKHWFQAYPLKRRTGFRRQKTYARSERLR
jgi:branched-chain amino acid transport system permease protein